MKTAISTPNRDYTKPTRALVGFLLALTWSTAGLTQAASEDIRATLERDEYPVIVNVAPVTVDDFATAETHHMMAVAVEALDCLGQWAHMRGLTPIEAQNVVRMNRDTLYSSLVLDLANPATIFKPDTDGRYQSLLVVNEGHLARQVIYEPGEYVLTQEDMGSRYVAVIARTLVDAENSEDVALAHAAQDGLQVRQSDKGEFEVPNWDQIALEEMREALKVLGRHLPNRDTGYGASMDEVDPVAFLISSADAWGGWRPENAVYANFTPTLNDGRTSHVLTLRDVPSAPNAFWSISVYNREGFFQKNEYDGYVVNSRMAQPNDDGSVTIHFGGDPNEPNFLPIMEGWNYMLRIYLPEKEYFEGSWTFPEIQPMN